MAGRLTLWGAGELLTNFFTGGGTLPDNFFLAVTKTASPTPYVSGAELDEPLVGSYERLMIPATSAFWNNAGQIQVLEMSKDMSFVTALEDWGKLKYWALCDSPAGGNVYAFGDMDPVNVDVGETLTLFDGDLAITVGPFFNDKEL